LETSQKYYAFLNLAFILLCDIPVCACKQSAKSHVIVKGILQLCKDDDEERNVKLFLNLS